MCAGRVSPVSGSITATVSPAKSTNSFSPLQEALSRDIEPSGDLTESQLQLVRTMAGVVVLRDTLDVRILKGEEVNVAQYTRIANIVSRFASRSPNARTRAYL